MDADVEVYRDLDPDPEELLALYRTYDWWADRTLESVERAIEGTDVLVGPRAEDDALIAAGRVLTDYTYYAKIYDVIVAEPYRDEGLGEQLMAAIVDHPDLSALDSLALNCRTGLVDFYERCGFETFDGRVEHPDGDDEELHLLLYERGE
jgi:predicted GNAT family N-acyltransferase